MSRPAQARINLNALRHNLQRVRDSAPNNKVLAVVKANAYGHGMVRVAKALRDADAFGVASLEEALALRDAGIQKTTVLLEGFFEPAELTRIQMQKFESVIHHVSQVEVLEEMTKPIGQRLNVWVKVDTGMHRIGFSEQDIDAMWQRLRDNPLIGEMTLVTHLANADDRSDNFTQKQMKRFDAIASRLSAVRSVANSAGILGWPETHQGMLRPGIMLYGVSPFTDSTATDHDLQPVMTLQSKLIAVNRVKKGESVGYGGTWICPEMMPVGVVAMGYGDGYPRHAPTGTPVLVNGQRCALIGRVSMDMICVDLRKQPKAKVGDPVVLWGDGLPIEEVARLADTIAYELLCGVNGRVNFVEIS